MSDATSDDGQIAFASLEFTLQCMQPLVLVVLTAWAVMLAATQIGDNQVRWFAAQFLWLVHRGLTNFGIVAREAQLLCGS